MNTPLHGLSKRIRQELIELEQVVNPHTIALASSVVLGLDYNEVFQVQRHGSALAAPGMIFTWIVWP